eukprot:PRCOL_00005036-RA
MRRAAAPAAVAAGLKDDDELVEESPVQEKRAKVAAGAGALRVKKGGKGNSEAASLRAIELPIAHNLGASGAFVPAGAFTAKAGFAMVKGSQSLHVKALRLKRTQLSADEQDALSALVAADAYYTLAVPAGLFAAEGDGGEAAAAEAAAGEGSGAGGRVLASVRARCLADAGLQEHVVLHLDFSGNVVAMDISTPTHDCSAESDGLPPQRWDFSSTAAPKFPKVAPRLNPNGGADDEDEDDLAGTGARGGGGGGGKKKEETPQSFFDKYKIYIYGFLAVQVIQGLLAPAQERQGAQGGRAAGGGGGGGAAK